MKIDTKAKTIELSENETIGEAVEHLSKMFATDEWKGYKLQPTVITNTVTIEKGDGWVYPTTTPITAPHRPFDYPYNPPIYGDVFKVTCAANN